MSGTLENTTIAWADIRKAQERLSAVAYHVPVLRSRGFDERAGCHCFFKAENMQRSGSVRFRGVFNYIKAHLEANAYRAVVTHSSGNHAQAVALTASLLGIRAILALPEDAQSPKVAAAREYGADLEFYDRHRQSPHDIVRAIAARTGALLVPPVPETYMISGYATTIVELMEEIHDLAVLVLPFAADDLLAGCTLAAKHMNSKIAVYGAEPVRPKLNSDLVIKNLDVWSSIEGMLSVREDEVIGTQLFILERMKLLVEPSGTIAAAAVIHKKADFGERNTGILLSSGNADFHKLSAALSRHQYPERKAAREFHVDQYLVPCFSCQQTFDAVDAVFCNCLTPDRTLVCPRCLNCFCKAPSKYKDRFWQNAPQELWDREAEEHRRDSYVRPNPEPHECTRPLVLIVDEDQRTRQMAGKVIEDLGYGVIGTGDGASGLVMARKYVPEMILTDALMPRMDGREMCRRLKEDPATANIKVIISTALYTQSKYRTEAFKQFHVDEYLSKPISFNELRTLLQKYLG